ncbi:hypothetical protein CDL12_04522 [Handroanthus impetiginosus]|uniref:Uncharacterized protein n=1 Tax=Handroanthus impetiginosus TaxID=429701 RepID=A0A2G9HZ23_9LAMI|nr:hypothetical protein CDL12_04522 [Handroanthus impetiginosus]
MAKTLKINPFSSLLEIPTKSHKNFVLFLGILLIIIVNLAIVSSTSDHTSRPSSRPLMASNPSQETLFKDSNSKNIHAKNVHFRPRKRGINYRKSKGREFEGSDHEVPSGPNPISNR